MAGFRSTQNTIIYTSLALFLIAYLLTVASGLDPFLAFFWNLLSAFDINLQLLPNSLVTRPSILLASLIDSLVFALMAVALASFFFEFVKQINIRNRIVMSRVKKLKQHAIIVPYNEFALALAKDLESSDIKSVIIAQTEADAHKLYRMGIPAVVGNSKEIDAFNIAGIDRAKYVIAAADDDIENAMITVTAKSANARARIISRVEKFEDIAKLDSAGARRMIMPEITAGMELAEAIAKKQSSLLDEKPK